MNGQNTFLIGDEIVGARDIVDNGNASFTLSRLLRGRRGTEWAIAGHSELERFVQLSSTQVFHVEVPVTDDDVKHFYKTTTINGLVVPGSREFTWGGATLMPYAPANPLGVKSTDDWVFTWTRRTRVDGTMRDGRDVPLGEASEAYEVDILDESGVVVRTITGLATETATYTKAEQETDFGAPLSTYPKLTLTARFYQISEAVGRGFPREVFFDARGPAFDPFFSSVVLLTHMEATPPLDTSAGAHTLTVGAGATISGSQFKFGTKSLDCANATDGYVEAADHADWELLGGPWTVEGWVYFNSVPAAGETFVVVGQWLAAGDERSWALSVTGQSSGQSRFLHSEDGSDGDFHDAAYVPDTGVWIHLAADKNASGTLRTYVNGVVKVSVNDSANTYNLSIADLRIGQLDGGGATTAMDGFIDEVRITNGVARYDGAFSPPTAPFPDE